jgi:hypothetical protein
MSASDSITKAKQFNPSKVTYRAPLVNKRGGKSVQCQLNGAPIVLQFPLMLTWGVNERVDEQSGRVSYDMARYRHFKKRFSTTQLVSPRIGLERASSVVRLLRL